MTSIPVCPYCGNSLGELIPSVLEGIIEIRCPICAKSYGYSIEKGSFSLEESEDYYLSSGLFGKKVFVSNRGGTQRAPVEHNCLSLFAACLIIPVIIVVFIIIISLLLGMVP